MFSTAGVAARICVVRKKKRTKRLVTGRRGDITRSYEADRRVEQRGEVRRWTRKLQAQTTHSHHQETKR
jgi:hypothetical protein